MKNNMIWVIGILLFVCTSCQKENLPNKDINQIKYSKNNTSYNKTKLDSAQAINHIASIKIQELLDLSTLYAGGKRDTEIDSVIYKQMQSYFIDNDTTAISRLITELDSLKVKSAITDILEIVKDIKANDTLNIARFKVEYYNNKNQKVGVEQKSSKFILQKVLNNNTQEFKFYFKDFFEKDTTSVGKIK